MVMSDELVCYCARIDHAAIHDAIDRGATTLADIQRMTGACMDSRCAELNPKGVCCKADILAILEANVGPQAESSGCSCCSG